MKTYHVITKSGVHDYDITVDETDRGRKFVLFRSNNESWTQPGEPVMTLKTDEHDGTVILPKMPRRIECHEAEELHILLKFASLLGQEQYIDDATYNVFESGTAGYQI